MAASYRVTSPNMTAPLKIGSFSETIKRGAFTRTLADNRDILALADHDPSRVLGRTRSGTLELREDDTGLAFALQMPDTQAGRDLVALAERGDLGGAALGFPLPMVATVGTEIAGNCAPSIWRKSPL